MRSNKDRHIYIGRACSAAEAWAGAVESAGADVGRLIALAPDGLQHVAALADCVGLPQLEDAERVRVLAIARRLDVVSTKASGIIRQSRGGPGVGEGSARQSARGIDVERGDV